MQRRCLFQKTPVQHHQNLWKCHCAIYPSHLHLTNPGKRLIVPPHLFLACQRSLEYPCQVCSSLPQACSTDPSGTIRQSHKPPHYSSLKSLLPPPDGLMHALREQICLEMWHSQLLPRKIIPFCCLPYLFRNVYSQPHCPNWRSPHPPSLHHSITSLPHCPNWQSPHPLSLLCTITSLSCYPAWTSLHLLWHLCNSTLSPRSHAWISLPLLSSGLICP